MDTIVTGGAQLIHMSIGPIARCINNSRVSKKADLSQTHIDACWDIIGPITEAIPRDRYDNLTEEIMAVQNLLEKIRNKTRFPHSIHPVTWQRAQEAERRADTALRLAKTASSLAKAAEIDRKRNEMERRDREAAQLREREENERLAREEEQRVEALVQKRLAEVESQRLSEKEKQGLADKERKRHADKAKKRCASEEKRARADGEKKQRAEVETRRRGRNTGNRRGGKENKDISAEDVERLAAEEAQASQELLQACDRLGVDPKDMMGIMLKIIRLKAAGKPVNIGTFRKMIRQCINETKSPSTKLPPAAVDDLVAVMTNGLSSLVVQATPTPC